MGDPPKLTNKQKIFIDEYLVDMNASRAAVAAGYSEDTAGAIGHENLNKPEIKEIIGQRMARRSKVCEVTAERAIRELCYLAFGDISEVGEIKNGGLIIRDSKDIPKQALAMISQIKTTYDKDGNPTTTVKFHNKEKALELLGKYNGWLVDKTKVELDESWKDFIKEKISNNGSGDIKKSS